ncbi:hypothetical protein DSECCO2_499660 [anaerobic digester metagenome]
MHHHVGVAPPEFIKPAPPARKALRKPPCRIRRSGKHRHVHVEREEGVDRCRRRTPGAEHNRPPAPPVGERSPHAQPVGVIAVHPAAAPDDGVHRPDRRRVAVNFIEVAHDIGLERYRDREPLCGKEGGEADDGACVRPLEASVVVTHPKARKEPVVEERALAVGAGVAGDGAHHETRIAVDHIPDIRKSEPLEEDIPLALLVP